MHRIAPYFSTPRKRSLASLTHYNINCAAVLSQRLPLSQEKVSAAQQAVRGNYEYLTECRYPRCLGIEEVQLPTTKRRISILWPLFLRESIPLSQIKT